MSIVTVLIGGRMDGTETDKLQWGDTTRQKRGERENA